MRTRTLTPLISLVACATLALGLAGPAVAQDASPDPSVAPTLEERKAARQELRAERKALRAELRAERKAAREEVNAAWKAAREEARAAWKAATEGPREELRAAREQWKAERAEWREANRGRIAIDELYTDAAEADASGVVRTDLGLADPASAPGEQLGLWHYLIPAGQELAPHTHPGWQLARLTHGELEYTVLEGEGVLLRADGSHEPMGPGTYVLGTGDGVIENPELVHLGANRTDDVVTIISATLFEDGEPVATVEEEEPATTE